MRVTSTKPKKYTTVGHYPLHRATVMVRGASDEEVARCTAVAASEPWAKPHSTERGVWVVQQPYEGRPSQAGGADHDAVDAVRETLVDEMRDACGAEVAK